jgi:hypothetical protein
VTVDWLGDYLHGNLLNSTRRIIERRISAGLALFWRMAAIIYDPALCQSHASLGPVFLSIIWRVPFWIGTFMGCYQPSEQYKTVSIVSFDNKVKNHQVPWFEAILSMDHLMDQILEYTDRVNMKIHSILLIHKQNIV